MIFPFSFSSTFLWCEKLKLDAQQLTKHQVELCTLGRGEEVFSCSSAGYPPIIISNLVMQGERGQMQAHVPTRDDPFHSAHRSSEPGRRGNGSFASAKHSSGQSSQVEELPMRVEDTYSYATFMQTDEDVPHKPRTDPPVSPGPGAPRADILEYIKQQLDCFGKDPLLRNRFQLLGPAHRATGGACLR
jgi:hypothetical protein